MHLYKITTYAGAEENCYRIWKLNFYTLDNPWKISPGYREDI